MYKFDREIGNINPISKEKPTSLLFSPSKSVFLCVYSLKNNHMSKCIKIEMRRESQEITFI